MTSPNPCPHCGEHFEVAALYEAKRRKFCSKHCSVSHQYSLGQNRCRQPDPEITARIARMLRTDRGAQDLLNKLLGRAVF